MSTLKLVLLLYCLYLVALIRWGVFFQRMRTVGRHFVYQALIVGSFFMLLPFYWMLVTSYKDASLSLAFPPKWLPVRTENTVERDGQRVRVEPIRRVRDPNQLVPVVPLDAIEFRPTESPSGRTVRKKSWDPEDEFRVRQGDIRSTEVLSLSPINFVEAWYAPEVSTLGAVNFGQYFWVSIYTGVVATAGALITAALAAYALARCLE